MKTTYTGQDINHIPGLHLKDNIITGPEDAFAVMALRRGEPAPKMPPLIQVFRKETGLHTSDTLRPYQRYGIHRVCAGLVRDNGHILADDMGLGKTLQTIAAWDGLNRPYPLLVVAPASVRRGWVREFKKWLGLDATLIETGKKAGEVMPNTGIVITSYELVKQLPKSFVPHMMVLDELHLLRGRQAKRSHELVERAKMATYRLGLTGTPMWGRPRDLWQPLKVLFPNYRFGTADAYDFAYCDASYNKWGGKENKGATRTEELKLRLSYVMTRRTKAELGDQLPSLTRVIRWLPRDKRAADALTAFALRQLHLTDALKATLLSKMKPVVEAVSELDGHAVVFTWQREDAHELVRLISEEGYPAVLITGEMTHKQRESAVDDAAARKACVVATIESTGTGVDGLQRVADTVLFHALDYTPIKMAQAESRCHRLGQTKPVTAVFFALEDSADRLVVQTVVEKLDAWRQTMGSDSTSAMNDVMAAPQTAEAEARAIEAIYETLDMSEDSDE